MTTELGKKLRASDFEVAHRVANTILQLDPKNPEATRAEKFTVRRLDDTNSLWGRSAAVWFLLVIFLGVARFFDWMSLPSGIKGLVLSIIIAIIISSAITPVWLRLPWRLRSSIELLVCLLFCIFLIYAIAYSCW